MSAARRAALQAKVAERELDALLVTNLVNVRWLTGFDGSNAAVVLGASQLRFITDFRYLTQSAEQLDAEWEREIATDLLKRAVEGLPAAAAASSASTTATSPSASTRSWPSSSPSARSSSSPPAASSRRCARSRTTPRSS